jgi:membrane protease YdiL (CAAX protease family)
MTQTEARRSTGSRVPVLVRAVLTGLLIGLGAANVWPVLLATLGMPLAAGAEVLFLALYLAWAAGNGPPKTWRLVRAESFRARRLTGADWLWGLIAAVSFAATVHAAMVVLFRLVPFPAAEFRLGYDLSGVHGAVMRWLVIVISAASAGICEETGFRGYMQQPIEGRHGPLVAILISSVLFTLLHLNKGWALVGMVPIVFGAGLLLGTLAWASRTLVFAMIGHTIMDVGLFAYWWTQIAGTFSARPISETGMDRSFSIACVVLATATLVTLVAIARLGSLQRSRVHTR